MSKLLVANWKMNGELQSLKSFAKTICNTNMILALPYPLIPIAKQMCETANIAAQNCSEFKGYGSYTGEVSSDMLKDFGATYVIIGHSERRNLLRETSQSIKTKIQNSLQSGLQIIYCVSENFEKQIVDELTDIDDKTNIMIAYEPVSAIGTGKTPLPCEVDKVAQKIREILDTKILYGGSISSQNIMDFCTLELISGVLVGGASLKIDELNAMLLQIQESI